jgi:hypothetical protein
MPRITVSEETLARIRALTDLGGLTTNDIVSLALDARDQMADVERVVNEAVATAVAPHLARMDELETRATRAEEKILRSQETRQANCSQDHERLGMGGICQECLYTRTPPEAPSVWERLRSPAL